MLRTGALIAGIVLAAVPSMSKCPPPTPTPTPPVADGGSCAGKTPVCGGDVRWGCWQAIGPDCVYISEPDKPPVTTTTTTTTTTLPPSSACSVWPKEGSELWVRVKNYGNGFDTELNVYGDPEFCRAIHGVGNINCHLEGMPNRTECEMALMGKTIGKAQACPVAFFTDTRNGPMLPCRQAAHPSMSCDHWGSAGGARDDPQTPEFTGEPKVCGEQRDPAGDPTAGFFWIAHGKGTLYACLPDGTGCSRNGIEVDF